MPSKRKLAPIAPTRGSARGREQEIATVEIDATFGRLLDLTDTQQVRQMFQLRACYLR